jgi:hypothetical protein
MAGVLGIYGLIVAVILNGTSKLKQNHHRFLHWCFFRKLT